MKKILYSILLTALALVTVPATKTFAADPPAPTLEQRLAAVAALQSI